MGQLYEKSEKKRVETQRGERERKKDREEGRKGKKERKKERKKE